jgi:hypothetical protein
MYKKLFWVRSLKLTGKIIYTGLPGAGRGRYVRCYTNMTLDGDLKLLPAE